MINRRHIRMKVMQSVYAMQQSHNKDIDREEKFLQLSIRKMLDLYVLNLDLLIKTQEIANRRIEKAKSKILATKEELNPNMKFVDNSIIKALKDSVSLDGYIELNKLDYWHLNDEYAIKMLNLLEEKDFYKKYMSSTENSVNEDRALIIDFFTEIIAPSEFLAEFYEDTMISWTDDIPYINTWVLRSLEKISSKKPFILDSLYKDNDDKKFVSDLFAKVVLHQHEYDDVIQEKTPNWEVDRISGIDLILIKMGITEFLHFPSIPVRVTINEYIELSKDYSTVKSGKFINGVLDKLSKDYDKEGALQKIGRGLL